MPETRTALQQHHQSRFLLCLVGSVLLHLVMIPLVILLLPRPIKKAPKQGGSRLVLVTAKAPEPKEEGDTPTPPEAEHRPFAKTDADRPQQHPDKADFEGQRDSRAEGSGLPQESTEPLPTMEGEEKDEINTLHQERQDGDIAYYGKETTAEQPEETESAPANNSQSAPVGVPIPPTPAETPPADSPQQPHNGAETHSPAKPAPEGDTPIQQSTEEVTEAEPTETAPTLPAGIPEPSISPTPEEDRKSVV